MADLNLSLRIRANADGSLQVIHNTTNEINQLNASATNASHSTAGMGLSLRNTAIEALSLRSALGALAGGFAAVSLFYTGRSLVDYADSLNMIDSRVKVATSSMDDYINANKALVAVSLSTHSSLSENANLFARTNKSIEQMGGSFKNTLAFTDLLAKSLKISGASLLESNSVTRQMSQAFASGVMRGDEFNSMMENGSRLAYALADGLHVGVGELRKMAEAGQLTAPKVLESLLSQSEQISDEFKKLPVTVAMAWQNVETQFGRYLKSANDAHGATSALATGIGAIANHLKPVLDGLVMLGEVAVFALVSQGVTSLQAFVVATQTSRASAAMLALHAEALVLDAQRTLQLTTATATQITVERAATQARLAGTLSMGDRMAVTQLLNVQTRALTTATIAQATAQEQLNAIIAAATPKLTLMGVAMGTLNAAFAVFMGWQIGQWLNQFDFVANTATRYIAGLAKTFENLNYWKNVAMTPWGAGYSSKLDELSAAHKRNVAAINDNVESAISWRAALEKAGLSEAEYKDFTLSTLSPQQKFNTQAEEQTRIFKAGLQTFDQYNNKLITLRNELDRLNEISTAPFDKAMGKIQDKINQVKMSPIEYLNTQLPKDVTDPVQQGILKEKNAEFIAAQEAQSKATKDKTAATKELKKEESDAEKVAKSLNKAYEDRALQMEREIELYGNTTKSKLIEFELQHGILKGLSEEKWLRLSQLSAKQDNLEVDKKQSDIMKALADRYKQLTLSASDYNREKLKSELVSAGAVGEAAQSPYLKQFDTNTKKELTNTALDDAKKASDSYYKSIDSASQSMKNFGDVSSAVFDGALGGINALVGAFDNVSKSIAKNSAEMSALTDQRAKDTELFTAGSITQLEYSSKQSAATKEDAKLSKDKTDIELTGTRQVAAAAAKMFGEKSAAAKAFNAISLAVSAAQLAIKASEIAANIPLTISNIAAGAAAMFAQGGFAGFAGVAAMGAVMAGLGFAMSGGGGGSAPPKQSPSTGTVLGDSSASSNSNDNIYDLLKSIHASEYAELRGINDGVTGMKNAIALTVNRSIQAGGIGPSIGGGPSYGLGNVLLDGLSPSKGLAGSLISTVASLGVSAGITALTSAGSTLLASLGMGLATNMALGALAGPIGLLLSGILSMFSGGYTNREQTGILAPAQTMGSISDSGFQAKQYELWKIRGWDWLSDWTDWVTKTGELNSDISNALTTTFQEAGKTVSSVANFLKLDVQKQINDYQFPELRVDLKGLSADDASKKLSGVINTMLDNMYKSVLSDSLGKYQQAGEGMYQTAVRMVATVAVVTDALATSGRAMGNDALAISDALVNAAGGLKQFQQQFNDFYDKFFTDTQKQARLQGQLTDQLTAQNLVLPQVRQGYADLIKGLDLSTASGQKQYSTILALSGAADTYYSYLEKQQQQATSNLTTAYNAQKTALQGTIDKVKQLSESLKTFSASLLQGALSPLTPQQKLISAEAAYSSNLSIALSKATTDKQLEAKQTAIGNLPGLAQTFLEASRAYNASGSGYQSDYTKVLADTQKAGLAADQTKTIAEQQLAALNNQVSGLITINQSVLSVVDAIRILDGKTPYAPSLTGITDSFRAARLASGATSTNEAFVQQGGQRWYNSANAIYNANGAADPAAKSAIVDAYIKAASAAYGKSTVDPIAYINKVLALEQLGITGKSKTVSQADNNLSAAINLSFNAPVNMAKEGGIKAEVQALINELPHDIRLGFYAPANLAKEGGIKKAIQEQIDFIPNEIKLIFAPDDKANAAVIKRVQNQIDSLQGNIQITINAPPNTKQDNAALIKELQASLEEQKQQNAALQATIKVLQSGFTQLVAQGNDHTDALLSVDRNIRKLPVNS